MFRITTIAILTVLVVAGTIYAKDDVDNILKKVQKKYTNIDAVCADFVQIFHWTLADETRTTEGEICAKEGEKFRINTSDQLIVTDGKTLWTLDKMNNQVVIDHAENSDDNPFLKSFFHKYVKKYSATYNEAKSTNDIHCIVLSSKSENEFIQQVTLWIDEDKNIIQKVAQEDINENTTTFEVTDMNTNITLSKDTFTFEPEQDMKLIDLR